MAKEWTLLLLCGILGSGLSENPSWFENISTNLFKSPGDIMIGGLFPINELTSVLSKRVKPDDLECNSISTYGLSLSLVMKFSVDEINSLEDLLPGITLGFESYDTCMQPAVVMKPVLQLLTKESTEELDISCNYTDYKTRVIAIIGPNSSELVPVIGKLIGFFLMPLISYGATSDMFSDKETFPSFMRTVPSDRWQVAAMVQLLKEFGWNWVSIVGSDDEYGQKGQQQFSSMANEESICVAYQGLIPVYSDPEPAIKEILSRIVDAKVGVVVVFSLPKPARDFFIEVIKRNITAVWVASTGWSLNDGVFTLPGINSIGTVLAFADITRPLRLFSPYIHELLKKMEETQIPQEPDTEISPLDNPCPSCSYLSQANMSMVEVKLVQRSAFSVYTAIYCVAYALHDLLGCNATSCALNPKTDKVYPWQLLQKLQKVSVDLEGANFKFDKEGNPNFGYDFMQWIFNDTTVQFDGIGYFYQNLTIDKEDIKWHTKNGKVPLSTCSSDCGIGQVRRVKGFHSCCFDCIDCKEGTYLNNSDDIQCRACPTGQWSTLRSTSCVYPIYTYLDWSNYESIGLILGGILVLASHVWVGALFFMHRGTSLVKTAGGPLIGLTLLSLAGECISLVLFLGQPGDIVCRLQQPLNAFFPTVALSVILTISLQIVCVTEFPEKSPDHLENLRGRGSLFVILGCCGLQAGLCGWYAREGPSLTQYVASLEVNYVKTFLRCPVEPMLNCGLMLGFNVLLALISFMSTFMALKPPGQYNLARDITISTLSYCVVWVMFIPIYTSLNDKDKSIAQVGVSLLSNIGLVAAYFFPKCHLLVKHPELNTDDHFRTFLEGVPPTPPEES
ncbi:taste receptor type 1 member 3 isoform X1 [Ctenopharyngodon idella]|uniref:Taste receptor type 1 member 3 n=1 Tax=Ctenopharyngodon idella TaxID=7959 RepID=A0A2R2UK49_CTEID|nr:taste receptor type 1 member 3 isoform X1 [Ctenopharyngodon idella]XP_051769380.1 taste receptor type 1 member 3 isoform X1 [Ctenopharyngodon idella]APG29582.1 taste receptor family 1 member 3 [Ctenopharyngodon idella]